MKKRLLSFLLVFCVVLGLAPTAALAADASAQQNEIGAIYPAIFQEYKGYYYALWEENGAITRHKADGSESKVLYSYGNLTDLNTLTKSDYYKADNMKDYFVNMAIYQDKIYVSVSKNHYVGGFDKVQYAAIYTMNLDGTDWKEVVKTSENAGRGSGSGPKTALWCIWNDRIYYYENLSVYSVDLIGGDKKQTAWKEYSDRRDATGAGMATWFYGDEAYLQMKYRSAGGKEPETEFRLFKVNLQTGVVTQYKTMDFKATVQFVAEGWVYVTSKNEWWRIKADGSEQSEYLGDNISGLTAFKGNLYYIEASSKTAYRSDGLGKVQKSLALSKPGVAADIIIAGNCVIIDKKMERKVTDLGGSTETFALAYQDKANYMDSSLVKKSIAYVYRPTFKGTSAPAGLVEKPVCVTDTYFAGGTIQNGWYNLKCNYKYINISAAGNAELRYNTPTTAYYFEKQGDKLYTIKTRAGKYLSVAGERKNSAQLTTSDTPFVWQATGFGQIDGFALCPADNLGVAAAAAEAKFTDGTPLILWTRPSGTDGKGHYVVRLLPVDDKGVEQKRYSIKMSSWAYPSLSYHENSPFMEFGPDYTKPMNREQMVQAIMAMTYNLTGQDVKNLPGTMGTGEVPNFTDTSNRGAWYLAYWGITSGVGNNKFDPQGLVTREQMASFLVRTMNYYNTELRRNVPQTKGNVSQFKDAGSISGWAKDAIAVMVGSGYLSGSDGKVLPGGYCTIEQALILCDRIGAAYRKADSTSGEVRQEGFSKSWYVDGNFTIESKLGGYLTINGEGKGVINKSQSQVFTRTFQSEGIFTLRTADGKYLAISGLPEDAKQLTVQNEAFLWYITDGHGVDSGHVLIKPLTEDTQYTLNVSGSSTEDGAPIIVFTSKVGTSAGTANYWAEANENFKFTRVK